MNAASVGPDDLVIEIGPGRGILTRELAERCGRLIAVELDQGLAEQLKSSFARSGNVAVVRGDILRFPLPKEPYKVLGNIPYNATAAIVRRLTNGSTLPEDIHLVMQVEAAERFAGSPYAPETQMSLLLKPQWQVEILRQLSRTDFDPPPRVESAMLWMAKRPRPLIAPAERRAFERFIRSAFGKTGVTVRQCVKGHLTSTQLVRLSRLLNFDPNGPPSHLTFEQWLGLFRFVRVSIGPQKGDSTHSAPSQ